MVNVHSLRENPLLRMQSDNSQEVPQHSSLAFLARALQLLQLLFGEEPVTLGLLCRDDSVWERLFAMTGQRDDEFSSVDWGTVRAGLRSLYDMYCWFGPPIEEVIQDVVGALLAAQIATRSQEVLD